jgi:hypothetical protein
MMKEKVVDTRFIGFTAVAVMMGVGFALAMTASADTTPGYGYAGQKEDCTAERHALMQDAFTARDYDAWKALMTDKGRVTQVVTEDNFDTFVEMHTAKLAGDDEKAQKLRTELGLGMRMQDGNGYKKGQGGGNGEGRGHQRGMGMSQS